MITISAVENHNLTESQKNQIKDIFFHASSVKSFTDENKREKFFDRWLGWYLGQDLQTFVATVDNDVIGYLVYCADTFKFPNEYRDQSLQLFEKYWDDFPAHLHINCDETYRGRGVGSKLINACMNELSRQGVKGVHIVTSPGARNVKFYRNLGFDREFESQTKDIRYLMMGKMIPPGPELETNIKV